MMGYQNPYVACHISQWTMLLTFFAPWVQVPLWQKLTSRAPSGYCADRHLLAMEWKGSIFFNNCLPFGLRSAPKLFNVLAELLEWIAEQNGVTFSIHYLDDFLTMGPRDTPICGHNLKVFTQLCHQLGVPLALEKVEGPATCLTFLGISIDSRSMLTSLPNEKLERIRNEISVWISRKTATKKQILSLVGLLQHATKVVRPGKTFVARMYSTAAKLKKLTFLLRSLMLFAHLKLTLALTSVYG